MSETVFAADPTRLLIAALVRASVGAAVVAMTMAPELWHPCGRLQDFRHYTLQRWSVRLPVVQRHSVM